jgi:[ribosomal protein S5]-alanine N-acetyltransferase
VVLRGSSHVQNDIRSEAAKVSGGVRQPFTVAIQVANVLGKGRVRLTAMENRDPVVHLDQTPHGRGPMKRVPPRTRMRMASPTFGNRIRLDWPPGHRPVIFTITTRRLLLRDFALSDVPDVHAYASDIEVVRRFPFGPNTLEQTQAFVQHLVEQPQAEPRDTYDLAIVLKASERVIGSSFLRVTGEPQPTGFLTYMLHREHWGYGYATEVARALIGFAFAQHGAHRVSTYCDLDNIASQRVLAKAGMQREGLVRESDWIRGAWHDQDLYAILRQDWQPDPQAPGAGKV